MIREYIQRAMHKAHYDKLDDGTYYGEIEGFEGVYANASTLEACRDELEEVLDEWILLQLQRGESVPAVDSIILQIEATG
jgi:predicted RNase H-like HicB family nuclease